MTVGKFLLFCVVVVASASVCLADLIAPPTPYVVSSQDGSHYFKMIPDKKDIWNKAKAKGVLYKVRPSKDKVVYTTSGWYAYKVFISNNGKFLIRMGDWGSSTPNGGDLAVAFYIDGQLKKSYSTVDLLKEPANVPRSVSHYRWLVDLDASYLLSEMFSVDTVEKSRITFDVTSGKILFWEPVKATAPCK